MFGSLFPFTPVNSTIRISLCGCCLKRISNIQAQHLAWDRWHCMLLDKQVTGNWSTTWQRERDWYVTVRLLNVYFCNDSVLIASETGYWGRWNFGLACILVLFSGIPPKPRSSAKRREVCSYLNVVATKTLAATATIWTWYPSHLVTCCCAALSLWLLFQIL